MIPAIRSSLRAGLVALALLPAALAGGLTYDADAGPFHVHLMPSDTGFEVHVHDHDTEKAVDLSKARITMTLLAGGRTSAVPFEIRAAGVMASRQKLPAEWTVLVRLEIPGQKPAQARFSSKQKPGGHVHEHRT